MDEVSPGASLATVPTPLRAVLILSPNAGIYTVGTVSPIKLNRFNLRATKSQLFAPCLA